MIHGIGIDIVRVDRIARWLDRPQLLSRYFHPDELEYVRNHRAGPAESLAARFAAKEAFGKALGTGLRGIRLRDIHVVNDANGRPAYDLQGTAERAASALGTYTLQLSMTHERNIAVAVAILEVSRGEGD